MRQPFQPVLREANGFALLATAGMPLSSLGAFVLMMPGTKMVDLTILPWFEGWELTAG